MGDVAVAREDLRDPLGVRFFPYYEGRDAARTPMQWSNHTRRRFHRRPRGRGSRSATWPTTNVAEQRDDPDSVLTLCRDVIAYRRRHPDFAVADYRSLPSPEGVWAFGRGERHAVVLNMSAEPRRLEGLAGTVTLCTDRSRHMEVVSSSLRVAAHEGLIVERR